LAGTVTGESASLWFKTHAGGTIPSFTATEDHAFWGASDFSLTLDRGTIEQDLIGQPGNYHDQGSLSMDGSFMMGRFGASASSYTLDNIVDGTGTNKYVAFSGQVADDGGGTTYLKWYLVSCQITGYDFTIGDASTITEASVDFVVLDPQNIHYNNGKISDSAWL